ncbi:uncharacterized protein CLUP02_17289 [Colletotrichum lupini]|uniref:Uncharacterized protein n=1 Tax=Colletotrichum lupini TaxID=145971 RepID=A0A9Q8SE86_9PEZI|nr:uncharacterized protein CLUP02_17289 [Colletotrichum lupini]UQC75781.1 hypothetical protein CLUP02_17289 [Colletotrichum lupini]
MKAEFPDLFQTCVAYGGYEAADDDALLETAARRNNQKQNGFQSRKLGWRIITYSVATH